MKCLVYLQTAEQQLFHAAESNDVQLAKHALDLHNVANIVNRNYDTPIHLAVRHESLDVLQLLLTRPVDLTVCNKRGNAPLHDAAIKGNLAAAKMLLRARRMGTKGAADPNQMQGLRLEFEKKSLIKRILLTLIDFTPAWRTGPEHLPLKTKGWTPLHMAAYFNDTHIGEELLKFGADVNSENEFGRTPLHLAAYGCKLEAALLLLMHGADPNKQDSKGDTPLHDAVFHDAFEIAELLLYYGASTRIANVAGKTASACATNITMVNLTTRPMHVAVAAGQITLVEGLLKHGCLVNEAGIMGETPLHLAAAHGDVETAKMLLENDADVNAVDADFNTPLHYAAGMGQVEVCEFLLENGAMPDLLNMDEKAPKQLVPVSRTRHPPDSSSHGHSKRRIVVNDDVVLKIARRVSTHPGVLSAEEWHDLQQRIPGRESTRYSIRGTSMSMRKSQAQAPAPELSAKVEPTDKSSRKHHHHHHHKPNRQSSRQDSEAAEAAAREHEQMERELNSMERAAALSDALKRHMQRLRPWGRVIPPPDLQEEAISAALDEVDGEGAGLAHRRAAYEDFIRQRRERLGKGHAHHHHHHHQGGGEGAGGEGAVPQAPTAAGGKIPMDLG